MDKIHIEIFFIHPVHTKPSIVLSASFVPRTGLGTGDIVIDKKDIIPDHMVLIV